MRHNKRKIVFFSLAALSVMLFAGACKKTEDTDTDKKKERIAVICKGEQHQFWQTVKAGAEDAGKELGVKITFEAPADESQIQVQIDMVEKAIADHADAILLAPLDTEKLNSVIDKAKAEDIPVLTFDSDVTTPNRVATIGTDNITAGAIAARNAAERMDNQGKIAIVSFVQNAQTAIEREKGFRDEIKKHGDMEVVGAAYCNGDSELAKQQAEKFMEDYPDLKCIYAPNEGSALGVAQAVNSKDITVIGFDSSDEEIKCLEKDWIQGMMVQNPYNMGYLGVRNIYKAMQGQKIEEKINTGITFVNRDNLQDEDIRWLLYPMGEEE